MIRNHAEQLGALPEDFGFRACLEGFLPCLPITLGGFSKMSLFRGQLLLDTLGGLLADLLDQVAENTGEAECGGGIRF